MQDIIVDLHDWFAGQAIQLFSLTPESMRDLMNGQPPDHEFVAKFCYDLADAMMAERDKRTARSK